MTTRYVGGEQKRTDRAADRGLSLVPKPRRSLGDKLQELAFRSPKYLVAIESLVDYLLKSNA